MEKFISNLKTKKNISEVTGGKYSNSVALVNSICSLFLLHVSCVWLNGDVEMEEFALCWNKLKFAENLSTGFQSLFDRGDFVDCTIACDGQLLHCHKLVLAICSPYFKEILNNNPCRHPISKLKQINFIVR